MPEPERFGEADIAAAEISYDTCSLAIRQATVGVRRGVEPAEAVEAAARELRHVVGLGAHGSGDGRPTEADIAALCALYGEDATCR